MSLVCEAETTVEHKSVPRPVVPLDELPAGMSDREAFINSVFHALIVFASVKEHQRISTQKIIHVHAPDDLWQSVWRYLGKENRAQNIDTIEHRFKQAFDLLEEALTERESFENKEESKMTRQEMVARIRNTQFVTRAQERIKAAQQNIFPVLRQTYATDANITARLELLQQSIADKMEQVGKSLVFLDRRGSKV